MIDLSLALLIMVLVPAIAGCTTLGLNKARVAAGIVSSIATLISLFMAGYMIYELNAKDIVQETVWYLRLGTTEFNFEITRLNALSILFIALLGFVIALYSIRHIAKFDGKGYYHTLILWSLSAAIAAVTSMNWIPFLVFWEICTLTLFFMVRAGGVEAKAPAYRMLLLLASTDFLMALSVVFVVAQTHSLEITSIAGLNPYMVGLIFTFMLISALAKAGGIPFHTWIPDIAPSSPSTALALFPAAYDKLLGIFKLAIICHFLIAFSPSYSTVVTIIGMLTMLLAVLMAMVQHDIKKLLSFHAVSQVGYMITGIGIGTSLAIAGGLFHMINHVLYKGCLFLTAGAVIYATGVKEVDRLGGLAKKMPVTFVSALIAALAISGVPPLNGFVSKWMIYQAAFQAATLNVVNAPVNAAAGIVAVLASALTLASFIKYIHSVFLGPLPKEFENVKEVPLTMKIPMLILAGLCLLFGLFPRIPLEYLVMPSLKNLHIIFDTPITPIMGWFYVAPSTWATWSPLIATFVALFALALGYLFYVAGKRIQPFTFRVEVVKPFVSGEDIIVHYHGGHFYGPVKISLKKFYHVGELGGFSIAWRAIASVFKPILRNPRNGVFFVYTLWIIMLIMISIMGGVL